MTAPVNLDRYSRQMLLPFVGRDGQARLAAAHAMLIGCGALGCPVADMLIRAGVGTLTIIDRDLVELSNLQRQTLFTESDARTALPKAEAAAARLRLVNSAVRIHAIVEDFSADNALRILRPHPTPGVLIDATDNFQTRYLINDAAVSLNIPLIYGGAVGTSGMSLSILPNQTACLRCLFPDAPAPGTTPTCDTAGVLGPITSLIASLQAAEAIKVLLGRVDLLSTSLQSFDLLSNTHAKIDLRQAKRTDCPCCGLRQFEHLEAAAEADRTLCGQGAVQIQGRADVDLVHLHARLTRIGTFALSESTLRGTISDDAITPIELTIFADGRAIIKGTTDHAHARSIYARYIGT